MSVKQFAGQMRATIEDIKSKGTAAIFCDHLIAYLRQFEDAPEPVPTALEVEHYKANLQNWIETSKRQHEGNLEMFRAVIAAGQSAIKTSFLLNGGAAVALLAFIAHMAEVKPDKVPAFAACMLPFTVGVLVIAMTSGLTYLTQWLYANAAATKVGHASNIICIVLGIVSYAMFIWGLFATYDTFGKFT